MGAELFFIGVTRFSLFYPHAAGWNLTGRFSSPEEYATMLFSSARLDPRVEIFLNLTVPQLQMASSKYNFRHVVQISPQLPEDTKARLREAEAEYPFLIVSEQPTARGHSEDLDDHIRAFASEVDSPDGLFARFRLDDDDVLATDYFQQLEPYVNSANVGMNVSFGSGYQAAFYAGTIFDLRSLYHPRNSMGMAQICRVRASGRIEWRSYSNHARSDLEVPTILDSRFPTVLSLKHNGQDTFAGEDEGRKFEKATRLLGLESPADYRSLEKRFPVVKDRCVKAWGSEARLDNGPFPIELQTDAQAARFEILGPGIFEIDLAYESGDVANDRRIFAALPIRPKVLQFPWSDFHGGSIVAGAAFGEHGLARFPIYLGRGESCSSATIWQSRAATPGNLLKSVTVRGRSIDE